MPQKKLHEPLISESPPPKESPEGGDQLSEFLQELRMQQYIPVLADEAIESLSDLVSPFCLCTYNACEIIFSSCTSGFANKQ
jgi:hypothetical protein